MGLGAHRVGMPAVIGMLIAGILIGLLKYIPWEPLQYAFFHEEVAEVLSVLSKIGVVLIMFSAGLGTNLKTLKSTGIAAIVITMLGVLVPMALGWLVASLFFGFENVLSNLFYGAILTATSVSVTVAVLKELGKLESGVGTSIVAAAVIDDVIGIIILSVITGFSSGSENAGWQWFDPNAAMVVIKIVLFFVAAIAIGVALRKLFDVMERRAPHNRRIPILLLSVCFVYAYCAEKLCGVADITGAYIAGIPVVATNWKYAHEFIDDRTTGCIVPFGDCQKEFNERILDLYHDRRKLEAMKKDDKITGEEADNRRERSLPVYE